MAGSPRKRAERIAAGLPVAPANPNPASGAGMTPYDDRAIRHLTDTELAQIAAQTTKTIVSWAAARQDAIIAALERGLASESDAVAARLALSIASYVEKARPTDDAPVVAEAH